MRLTARILAPALLLAALAQPAFAADKLVPQTATGALEGHRGKPWTEPLFTCAGYHTYNLRRLKGAGDTSGAWDAAGKAVDLKTAGAAQYAKDKGVSLDAATATATKRIESYAFAVEAQDYGTTDFFPGWNKACDEIWAGWKKAGG